MFCGMHSDVGIPNRISLKPLDIETMKRLGTRVNLIPVIAKADTMTPHDIAAFKENVSVFRPSIGVKQWTKVLILIFRCLDRSEK
jgi:hypothetical protein